MVERTNNKGAYIGKMMLSDNGNIMWSAHLGGVILSAWNAHQRMHITDVDVSVYAEEKCHIDEDRIVTAMCVLPWILYGLVYPVDISWSLQCILQENC